MLFPDIVKVRALFWRFVFDKMKLTNKEQKYSYFKKRYFHSIFRNDIEGENTIFSFPLNHRFIVDYGASRVDDNVDLDRDYDFVDDGVDCDHGCDYEFDDVDAL